MDNNVCHFVPYNKDSHSIHTINYVLETKHKEKTNPKAESVYKMHFVNGGNGNLYVKDKTYLVSEGDIFFTFPGDAYSIESLDNFSYMYISFLGSRANMIMERLKISSQNFLFCDCFDVKDFWEEGLNSNSDITDLIAESILLYTFHFIGNKTMSKSDKENSKNAVSISIKKYIDDNFTYPELTLSEIGNALSYSSKYISHVFKKAFKVGLNDYINTVRIQYSCTLMNQGFTSISDISAMCGYADPQYFSKVFKSKMGISPREYIKEK